MSRIDVTSPEHCAKKGLINTSGSNFDKKLLFIFSTLFVSILSIILLICLILHPTKPEFSLSEANIYQLNLLSGPNYLVNSSILVTLLSRNPNDKVGLYYDDLEAYASYKGQQITEQALLPPFYQGHRGTDIISASLAGTGLPVSPFFRYEVTRDQIAGKIVLSLKVSGKVRWKVGMWASWRNHLNVNCIAVMAFGPSIPSGPLTTKQGTQCSTTI